MADTTVYPFGTDGQLPSGIGIINDLTTGGADKALSAAMGKELNETKADAENIVKKSYEKIEGCVFLYHAYFNNGEIKAHNNYSLIAVPYKAGSSGIVVTGYSTGQGWPYFATEPAIGSTTSDTTAPTTTGGKIVYGYNYDGYAVFHIYNNTFRAFNGEGYIKANGSGFIEPTETSVRSLNGACVTAETMEDGDIMPLLAPLVTPSKNLLNPEDILENKYIRTSDGVVGSYTDTDYNLAVIKNVVLNGTFVFSSNIKLSDVSSSFNGISVQPHGEALNTNIMYAATGNSFGTKLGVGFTIELLNNTNFMGLKITGECETPCDVYIYIGRNGKTAKLQFEKGTTATDYEEYGHKPMGSELSSVVAALQSSVNALAAQISDVKAVPSRFAGCNYVAFGDSITDERYDPSTKYTSFINDALSCETYTNYGRSGATASTANSSNSLTAHVRAVNLTNYDLATIMIGVNDKGYNVPLGTISSTDKSTFYGAMNDIITYMINANKSLRIVLLTPFNTSSSSANTQNLNVVDYADAIKEIGKKYSVPVIDCYGESGVCPLNWSTYTSDNLHLNATGHQWVADYIVAQLKNL